MNAYPLTWPEGWRRTTPANRKNAQFNRKEREHFSRADGSRYSSVRTKNLSVNDGVMRILAEMESMGIDRQDVIISTNVRVRLDGLPRSGEREPEDSGAAVYWRERGKPMRCMAVDRYTTVADNLSAIAATLQAMRAIERHGGAQILDRAFTGFTALPEKASQPWREVLGLQGSGFISRDVIEARFKELAIKHHPDKGGDADKFRALVAARDAAKLEVIQ